MKLSADMKKALIVLAVESVFLLFLSSTFVNGAAAIIFLLAFSVSLSLVYLKGEPLKPIFGQIDAPKGELLSPHELLWQDGISIPRIVYKSLGIAGTVGAWMIALYALGVIGPVGFVVFLLWLFYFLIDTTITGSADILVDSDTMQFRQPWRKPVKVINVPINSMSEILNPPASETN